MLRGERPLGVAVVAVFLIVDSVLAVAQILFDSPLSTRVQTLLDINEWMPAAVIVFAVVRVITAVGLWLRLRWAWVMAMLIVGIGLLLSFYLYWIDDPSYPRLAINVIIAFYLNQGAVRDYFERRGDADLDGDSA